MIEFIKTQYSLYKAGKDNIGFEKIQQLAKTFLSEEEQNKLFGIQE
jgi:hypothetical protein